MTPSTRNAKLTFQHVQKGMVKQEIATFGLLNFKNIERIIMKACRLKQTDSSNTIFLYTIIFSIFPNDYNGAYLSAQSAVSEYPPNYQGIGPYNYPH